MAHPLRPSAEFGKRIEYWINGRMLKEGLDVYVPLVDDDDVDVVTRKPDGTFTTVQIKVRSRNVIKGEAALFFSPPFLTRLATTTGSSSIQIVWKCHE